MPASAMSRADSESVTMTLPRRLEPNILALVGEIPPVERARSQHPVTDAVVLREINQRSRLSVLADIGGRGDNDRPEWRGEPHRHHVVGDHLAQPDSGVEALADDIAQAVIGHDVDRHVGKAHRHGRKDGHQRQRQGQPRRIDLEKPARPAFDRANALDPVRDVFQRRFRRGHERLAGLCQGDAARRAGEQWLADPLFHQPHRMADGGRAHAKFGGGQREAAAPRNGDDDGKVAKEIAIHSCMISHSPCG